MGMAVGLIEGVIYDYTFASLDGLGVGSQDYIFQDEDTMASTVYERRRNGRVCFYYVGTGKSRPRLYILCQ
jgi:hypothetical protein